MEQPDAFAEVAKAYAEDKNRVIDQLDKEEKENDLAAKEWSQRLEGDQVALEQLQHAAADFAKQPGSSTMDVGIKSSKGEVTVYSLPTPVFVKHVMSRGDAYPALSNAMVGQWMSSHNGMSYDRAFHDWWDRYHAHFDDSLLHPSADRRHHLAELAKYDRKFATSEGASHYDNFREHAKEYPHLSKHYNPDPKRKSLGQNEKPQHKDSFALGHDPNKQAHKGSHIKVKNSPPSAEHRLHRALSAHRQHIQHRAAAKKKK